MKKGERRRRKAGANNFPHSKNNNGALKISASVQKATKRKIPEQKETAPEKKQAKKKNNNRDRAMQIESWQLGIFRSGVFQRGENSRVCTSHSKNLIQFEHTMKSYFATKCGKNGEWALSKSQSATLFISLSTFSTRPNSDRLKDEFLSRICWH